VPKVRAAEWRDRAEAAQRDLAVIDLRDLRSVVSAADAAARDEESRALAAELRAGLATRVDEEQAAWLAELAATLEVGRIVRALRVSSRPPKAGTPLPADLALKLTEQASAALTADAGPERWVAVLDALAFSPVRDKVIPTSIPAPLHEDVRATIARLATRIPKLAHIFEIAPDRNAPRPKTERRRPKKAAAKPDAKGPAPKGSAAKGGKAEDRPKQDAPAPVEADATTASPSEPTAEAPPTAPAEAPTTEAPPTPPAEAPTADAPEAPAEPHATEPEAPAVDATPEPEAPAEPHATEPEAPAVDATPEPEVDED
jgi:hypothetical protein